MQAVSSPPKSRKLVIAGDSAFAQIAFEYFQAHSPYEVVAFTVEAAFLQQSEFCGRPVVPFETIEERFAPAEHAVHAAITYTQLNRLRTRLTREAKAKGYRLASFVSPFAFVHPTAQLGEHCFIFEMNVVQPFVSLGNDVVLWSGNHLGHHSQLGNGVFVSSHVVISGYCTIGENCFFGVNSSTANNINIARDCWFGPGVVITKDTAPGELYRSPEPALAKVSAPRFFRVKE